MSGHSKWATIKHKKGAADAKRGQIFSKLAKEIAVAARMGGGNVEDNPRLRVVVMKARSANMPKDNIDRAVKKGTGELEGQEIVETTYEGYAPGGVAILVDCLTDNKIRTVSDFRHILTKHGGKLATEGAVARNFSRKGYISVNRSAIGEDSLMELVLEAGATDMETSDEMYEIYSEPENFEPVLKALQEKNIPTVDANISRFPSQQVEITDEDMAKKILKIMALLEDHDDINNVYANFDMDEKLMEAASA